MGSIPDPGEVTELAQPSFDEFQRQTSLMTSCTLLWKELSDHINSLEQNLLKQSETLKRKIETLDSETKASLDSLKKRELSVEESVKIALRRVELNTKAAMRTLSDELEENPDGEVDNGDGLLQHLKSLCLKMEAKKFWNFVAGKKKELDLLREKIPAALSECIDPARFVMGAISEVFPVDKRGNEAGSDLAWACVLILESLIPVVVDPVIGKSRMLVTPSMKEQAKEIAETWKRSLEERGGIENVKTPDVHTFLQHLVTFGIVKKEDLEFYRKLVVASAWRKQMPKLALSLGLGDQMPDMIEELISKGQQLDAVHFTYEVGLVDKFPPAPLLKGFLRDAKKAASSILDDPNNTGRAVQLAARKEQSALKAVIKCIEEYKLEAEFLPENLKKRLEQLEKSKTEKRKPVVFPANKRTRASNGGPMPPAKAGRMTNAYVSSFPAPPPFVRSPSHTQYPTPVPGYPSPPAMYGNRSPPTNPYVYSPEAAPPPLACPYPGAPMNYPTYGGYGNGLAPAYQQAYYR
ncbi:FRIGIDA-like protein 4a [Hibiscus syriacus]|uniref:FRIGIDA-like protein n=1 Tax=Hibiscus syriacus TaxID=106335 RepID=A0A6A2X8G0_HIBSY|nr:FRIGIDA-like protein 4a [Hibiscus syriacus]KAE8663475.1 FRIGIDA-like protein 4a [Hibiscus syriacus]